MLLRMLKSMIPGGSAQGLRREVRSDESPVERAGLLEHAHATADVDLHRRVVLGDLRVGDHDLLALVDRCLEEAVAVIPARKKLHRPLASYVLTRYFLHSLAAAGEKAECGVFLGVSTLLLCRAAQTRDPSYAGAGLHAIDSFEGLAEPTAEDRFDGADVEYEGLGKGAYAAPIEAARRTLSAFPQVSYHRGWIPAVFSGLSEGAWSFVHLDVDHYEPTYASLDYFYPRLSAGGVIICDDYGSPTFPGAHRAWDRYCMENDVPFVVHDTGQSVLIKGASRNPAG